MGVSGRTVLRRTYVIILRMRSEPHRFRSTTINLTKQPVEMVVNGFIGDCAYIPKKKSGAG